MHEVVPEGAIVEIPGFKLPALLGIVETLLQPPALLVPRDMQEDLDDTGSLVREHLLERTDVLVAALPHTLLHELAHADGDHVLIVRAVEDHDLAARRAEVVDPPEVVVRKLRGGRRLERLDAAALRIDSGEDGSDRAVLARGVHALEDEQHGAGRLGEEPQMQLAEPLNEHLETLEPVLFTGGVDSRAGGKVVEAGPGACSYAQLVQEILGTRVGGQGRKVNAAGARAPVLRPAVAGRRSRRSLPPTGRRISPHTSAGSRT